MSTTTSPTKKTVFSGRKMWFIFAIIAGVVGSIAIFLLLQAMSATTTYYVLNKDVPARTLVTEDMLQEVATSQGGEPRTALTLGDVLNNQVYTRFSLDAGDTLTTSNAGALSPLTAGLPDNFVIGSFNAVPSVAAGGKIQRGDYVDLYSVTDEGNGTAAHVFLQRVLIVDATIDLDSATGGDDSEGSTTSEDGTSTADNSAYRSGIPVMFTVGLTQADAAKLAVATKYEIYVVLSSASSVEKGAAPAEIGSSLSDIIGGSAGDAGAGTDNTFGESKKDGDTTGTGTETDNGTQPQPQAPTGETSGDPATTGEE